MTEEQIKRILQAGHSVLCNSWDSNGCKKRLNEIVSYNGTFFMDEVNAPWLHAEIHPSVANRYFERDGIIYKWLTVFEAEEAEMFIDKRCLFNDRVDNASGIATLSKIKPSSELPFHSRSIAYTYLAVPLNEPAETPKQKQLRELKEKASELNKQIQELEE